VRLQRLARPDRHGVSGPQVPSARMPGAGQLLPVERRHPHRRVEREPVHIRAAFVVLDPGTGTIPFVSNALPLQLAF